MKGVCWYEWSQYTTAKTHNKFGVDVTISEILLLVLIQISHLILIVITITLLQFLPADQCTNLISENDNETLRVEIPLNFTLPGNYDLNGFLNLTESLNINESLVLDGVEFPGGIGGDPMGAPHDSSSWSANKY